MKRTVILLALTILTLAAACQSKDKIFNSLIRFNQGIQFGDGTIQSTAATGVGVVSWAAITSKPTTLSGFGITDAASLIHSHSLLYKPLSYVPTWSEILSKPTFATVATTGSFTDLVNVPEMMELEVALPSLPGIKLPVLTQTQINALTPVKGLLLFNDTDGVLQIYNGTLWKTIITNN